MAISPVVNTTGIEQQVAVQQVNSQNIQNQTSLDVEQNVSPSLSNQLEAGQSVSDYLKEISPGISPDELAIYENAGLKVEEVGDRICLNRQDIDWDYKDPNGMTNRERMENGLSPLNKDGLPYELHHVGQKNDAPLAELTHSEHMSPENNKTLHPIRTGSEVDHGYSWKDIREDHWKARAEQFEQQYYGV